MVTHSFLACVFGSSSFNYGVASSPGPLLACPGFRGPLPVSPGARAKGKASLRPDAILLAAGAEYGSGNSAQSEHRHESTVDGEAPGSNDILKQ
jgi:hypothetical protein